MAAKDVEYMTFFSKKNIYIKYINYIKAIIVKR